VESKSFKSTSSFSCERFSAYGFTFEVLSNSVTACQDSKCVSISSRGSYAFSYAASNESVFVGTNWGEAFLFHNSQWCHMIENDNKYACDDSNPSPDTSPGRQWYSSTPFGADALGGEYPGAWVWRFNGQSLTRDFAMTPPPYRGDPITPGFESQSLAFYCGSFYVGMWPYGELWRFDGIQWTSYTNFISATVGPPSTPYEVESIRAGEVYNLLGQRPQLLVVHRGFLWVTTSNKRWLSKTPIDQLEFPADVYDQYGVLWRVSDPRCAD